MYIKSFIEIADDLQNESESYIASLYGKKSLSLVHLTGLGVPVPAGWCLSVEAFQHFMDHNNFDSALIAEEMGSGDGGSLIKERILEGEFPETLLIELSEFFMNQPETHFAIRSSSASEDMDDASFAGIYESFLNQKGLNECLLAVKKCWASVYDVRVLQYCMTNHVNFASLSMPVLIQTMVPAEKSGVAFSLNPIKGTDTEVLIEAVYGLGEMLVGGLATPDSFTYDWFNEGEVVTTINAQEKMMLPTPEAPFVLETETPIELQEKAVLSEDEVRELSKIVIDIQAAYKFPVDVEWTQFEGKFHIVQARPITNVHYSGLDRCWSTADFKDGGVSSAVCSHFMWSLYSLSFDESMSKFGRDIKLTKEQGRIPLTKMMYGRPYWDATYIKDHMAKFPGFVERSFDEDLGVEVAYEGQGRVTKMTPKTLFAGLKTLTAMKKSLRNRRAEFTNFPAKQTKVFKRFEKTDPATMSDNDLYKFFEELVLEDYQYCETSYFSLIYDSSNQKTFFAEYFEKQNTDANFLNLIGGLTDLSHLLPNYDLWDISRAILADPETLEYWSKTSTPKLVRDWLLNGLKFQSTEINDYIKKYKFLSTRQLDITVPNLDEAPGFIFDSLKNLLDFDESKNPRTVNEIQHQQYLSEREKFLSSLPFYKRTKAQQQLESMREFFWNREEFRDYSTRMYYYMRKYTLIVGRNFTEIGILDNPDDIFHFDYNEILSFMKGDITVEAAREINQRNLTYYNSFEKFTNKPDVGLSYNAAPLKVKGDGKSFKGIPCSSGVIQGRVRVVPTIDKINTLEKGDILVTRFTDPGWTSVFGMLSGVLTETGGLLSHAAVISREYGIPAVLAVNNITSSLKDGQEVLIDGNTGDITLLN